MARLGLAIIALHTIHHVSAQMWTAIGDLEPFSGSSLISATSSALLGGILYVGGIFSSVDGINASSATQYNLTSKTWASLGVGLGNLAPDSVPNVISVAISTSREKVYFGGQFNLAGGANAGNVAEWSPVSQSWNSLGGGVSGSSPVVSALATVFDVLFVGGSFSQAGLSSVPVSNIASYNFSDGLWSSLGSGISQQNAVINSLLVVNSTLIVGGGFQVAGGVDVTNIASWDLTGGGWGPLGVGLGGMYVTSLATMNGLIYAGVTSSSGLTASLAVYAPSQQSWTLSGHTASSPSMFACISDIAPLAAMNSIFIVGAFIAVNGVASNSVALYSISNNSWSAVGSGITNCSGSVPGSTATAIGANSLVVGGCFTMAGGVDAIGIAQVVLL